MRFFGGRTTELREVEAELNALKDAVRDYLIELGKVPPDLTLRLNLQEHLRQLVGLPKRKYQR